MTTTSPPVTAAGPRRTAGLARAFLAVLWRDLYVTGRELPVFLAQVVLQPLFLLFVFGKVLTDLGSLRARLHPRPVPRHRRPDRLRHRAAEHRLPAGDRLPLHQGARGPAPAPPPVGMVAVEKVVFASLRALLAGLVMLPSSWCSARSRGGPPASPCSRPPWCSAAWPGPASA